MQDLLVRALVGAEAFDRPAHHDSCRQERTSIETFPSLGHTIPYSAWDSLMESSLADGPHLDRGGLARLVLSDQARGAAELALDEREFIWPVILIAFPGNLSRGRGNASSPVALPAGIGLIHLYRWLE